LKQIQIPDNLQAVILDMDGVLVDTEPLHIKSFCTLLDELGVSYKEEYVHSFVGYSIEDNVRRIDNDYFGGNGLDIQKYVEKRDKLYLDLVKSNLKFPIPGIIELVSFCQNNNIKTALASSSDRIQIDIILENLRKNGFDLMPVLAASVSGDEAARRKPLSDIYELALQKMDCPAEQAIAVEDSQAGVMSARGAGIFCAALKNPYNSIELLSEADALIDSIDDILKMIKSRNQDIGKD